MIRCRYSIERLRLPLIYIPRLAIIFPVVVNRKAGIQTTECLFTTDRKFLCDLDSAWIEHLTAYLALGRLLVRKLAWLLLDGWICQRRKNMSWLRKLWNGLLKVFNRDAPPPHQT